MCMIFLIATLAFCFCNLVLVTSEIWCPRLYNYVYFHEDYLLWERVLKCIDTIELFDDMLHYHDACFKIDVDGQMCHIWVWDDKERTVSIHGDSKGPIDCLTTAFDSYHGKLCKKLIFERVKDRLDKKYYYLFES